MSMWINHISACLDAGYTEIVSLVVSGVTRLALERDLPRSIDEEARGRVRVVPVKPVGSLL